MQLCVPLICTILMLWGIGLHVHKGLQGLRSEFNHLYLHFIELSFDVQATRKLLIRLLSDALLGDQLGAEFVLLHLLSAV